MNPLQHGDIEVCPNDTVLFAHSSKVRIRSSTIQPLMLAVTAVLALVGANWLLAKRPSQG